MFDLIKNKEGADRSKLTLAHDRHPSLDDKILSDNVLKDAIVYGIVDKVAIETSLRQNPYFIDKASEPPYQTLVYAYVRDESEVYAALSRVLDQLKRKEIVQPGEILHVFGVCLLLSDIGILNKGRGRVVKFAKTYIDALLRLGKLTPSPLRGRDSHEHFGSFNGMDFREKGTPEFQEVEAYLRARRGDSQKQYLRNQSERILVAMVEDIEKFGHLITGQHGDGEHYADAVIMSNIPPETFVETLLELPFEQQHEVLRSVAFRYRNLHSASGLRNELPWLRSVRDVIEARAKTMSQLDRWRYQLFVQWHLSKV